MTLYDEILVMVNMGRWTDVSASCRAFDMVPHDILNCKLEMGRFDGWTVQWIKDLAGWMQPERCGQCLRVEVEAGDE